MTRVIGGGLVLCLDGVRGASALTPLHLVVHEGGSDIDAVRLALARREGPRIPLVSLADGVERFVSERLVSIDTTASGGNATLLALAEG